MEMHHCTSIGYFDSQLLLTESSLKIKRQVTLYIKFNQLIIFATLIVLNVFPTINHEKGTYTTSPQHKLMCWLFKSAVSELLLDCISLDLWDFYDTKYNQLLLSVITAAYFIWKLKNSTFLLCAYIKIVIFPGKWIFYFCLSYVLIEWTAWLRQFIYAMEVWNI